MAMSDGSTFTTTQVRRIYVWVESRWAEEEEGGVEEGVGVIIKPKQ